MLQAVEDKVAHGARRGRHHERNRVAHGKDRVRPTDPKQAVRPQRFDAGQLAAVPDDSTVQDVHAFDLPHVRAGMRDPPGERWLQTRRRVL